MSDSSDQAPVPFIGKYHSVLRSRKNTGLELEVAQPKKQYKKKKIKCKNLFNIYQYWKLQLPLSHQHIYNFHNILAINEQSMRDPACDESFIATKFYMKKVKKVDIYSNALLFTLEDIQTTCTPISYICQRFKSIGESIFMKMAETIQHLEVSLPQINSKLQKQQQIHQNQLELFLKQMEGKFFFSQYSPHLLIISNSLVQMLGFNVEEFAIETIKNKSIPYQFFSAQNYANVIHQHLQNIQLLRQYLQNTISLQQFCRKSLMVYNDTVFNRNNQKIHCQFYAGTSKQLTPYIQIKNIHSNPQESRFITPYMEQRSKKIQYFKYCHYEKEYEQLKKLINIPKQMDPTCKDKMCTYKAMESQMDQQIQQHKEQD